MEPEPQLHDATLVSVEADWIDKSSRIVFRPQPGRVVILEASGLRNLVVPHEEPWGPSVSVNEVRTLPGPAVEIEMQSGDTIRIDAAAFVWHRSPLPAQTARREAAAAVSVR